MIEFKSSVKTQGGKTIYSGGGNIVPSASNEITNLINRNVNIRMQRVLSEFMHNFIIKGKTQFIKMYCEFAESEMRRRNQLGTGKTLNQLKSAKNLFNFKQSVKPVISVTLRINESSAKDFFEYAMRDYSSKNYKRYDPEEIIDWIKEKGFKYVKKAGKYYPATSTEIAERMASKQEASSKKKYKIRKINKSILWSQRLIGEPTTTFDEIQFKFENSFAEEFENSLTDFLNSKKIKIFQKKRGK